MRENHFERLLEYLRAGVEEVTIFGAVSFAYEGEIIHELGGENLIFGRSLMKPFQYRVFAKDSGHKFTSEQVAIAVSSHSAEPQHLKIVHQLLGEELEPYLKTPSVFRYGAANLPGETISRLNHPCSGKHSAILRGCSDRGWDLESYLSNDHPYQQAYREEVRSVFGKNWSAPVTATDGCGLPTKAMTVNQLALAYSYIAQTRNENGVWDAMTKHPELIGGTNRLDTAIMKASSGRIIAKEGADGIIGLAVVSEKFPIGLGVTIKISHGSDDQAIYFIAQKILHQFGVDVRPLPFVTKSAATILDRVVPDLT